MMVEGKVTRRDELGRGDAQSGYGGVQEEYCTAKDETDMEAIPLNHAVHSYLGGEASNQSAATSVARCGQVLSQSSTWKPEYRVGGCRPDVAELCL